MVKAVFAGTSEFARPGLDALKAAADGAALELVAVYTRPDRPAGRGRQLRQSPIKQAAMRYHLPVFQPSTLTSARTYHELRSLNPDLLVVIAYGLLLPPAILELPALGCVNLHASLLPRWRGAAPIQRAIAAGDTVTGVTLMRMQAGLDCGPVLAAKETAIAADATGDRLHDQLAQLGAELLGACLPPLLRGGLTGVPQDDAAATYAAKLSKAEARIDWRASAVALSRRIRAFTPWPGTETQLAGRRLRIVAAEPVAAGAARDSACPGEVLRADRHGLEVACGRGVLRITRIQKSAGRPMAVADFLNGTALPPGTRLS